MSSGTSSHPVAAQPAYSHRNPFVSGAPYQPDAHAPSAPPSDTSAPAPPPNLSEGDTPYQSGMRVPSAPLSGAYSSPPPPNHSGDGTPYQSSSPTPSAPPSGTHYPPPPTSPAPSINRAFAPAGYPQAMPNNMPATAGPPYLYYVGAPVAGAPLAAAGPGHGGTLQMTAAGEFSDISSKIRAVPAATVTVASACARLVELKRKFNELQHKRASYHGRQAANGGVAVASALFTAGTSLLLQGPAAIHQRNRLQQIVRAMRECVVQINMLRKNFAHTPGWDEAERIVLCDSNAFTKAINRQELHGEL